MAFCCKVSLIKFLGYRLSLSQLPLFYRHGCYPLTPCAPLTCSRRTNFDGSRPGAYLMFAFNWHERRSWKPKDMVWLTWGGVVLLRMIVLPTIVIDEHSTCCWQSWGHGLRTICIQRDSQHNRKSDTVKLGLWNLLAIYTSCFPQLSNTKIFKADCNCCNLFSKAKLVIHLEFGSNFNWVFSTLEPYKPV